MSTPSHQPCLPAPVRGPPQHTPECFPDRTCISTAPPVFWVSANLAQFARSWHPCLPSLCQRLSGPSSTWHFLMRSSSASPGLQRLCTDRLPAPTSCSTECTPATSRTRLCPRLPHTSTCCPASRCPGGFWGTDCPVSFLAPRAVMGVGGHGAGGLRTAPGCGAGETCGPVFCHGKMGRNVFGGDSPGWFENSLRGLSDNEVGVSIGCGHGR